MSLLQKLTTGKTPAPPRVLIYSDPGVGKSSFAATAPKPVFIPLEDGLDQINCTKFPHVKDFATLIADLKAVAACCGVYPEDIDALLAAVVSLEEIEEYLYCG